jgi:hypothetical protein
VIVALSVRPVAFVAMAVAVAVAGSGRVLLTGLPRWAVVVVVSGRPVVTVPVVRVARRYAVPVTDREAARRGMMHPAGLSGWGVVPVPDRAAARCVRGVAVTVVSRVVIAAFVHRRRRLGRRRSRGCRSRGRRSRRCRCGRRRRAGSGALVLGRWLVVTPGLRGLVRGATDRVRPRSASLRSWSADGGRRPRRTLRPARPVVCARAQGRRGHHDLGGRRRGRSGAGTGAAADPDRPEMWWQNSRAGGENQGHRGSAEDERDDGRRRCASKIPDCAPCAAFVGRQRPSFPFPHGHPRP